MKLHQGLLFIAILILPLISLATLAGYIRTYTFPSEAVLKSQWKEKIFNGRTEYGVKEGFLFGRTKEYSSALYAEVADWNLEKNPILSWEWRVEKFPPRQGDLSRQSEDYPMRVIIVFPARIFLNSKAIAYAWDPRAPKDTIYESAVTKNMKIIVAESGPDTMQWKQENRNVLQDYVRAFGQKPDRLPGAVGILVDADDEKQWSEGNVRYVNVGGPS